MKEILQKYVKQISGEAHRRWFEDDYFDLLVWEDGNGKIVGFQLCYDKVNNQHALTWKEDLGYNHNKVDDGESKPGKYKSAPILIADGIFDNKAVSEKFKLKSKNIEAKVSAFVYKKIKFYNI